MNRNNVENVLKSLFRLVARMAPMLVLLGDFLNAAVRA